MTDITDSGVGQMEIDCFCNSHRETCLNNKCIIKNGLKVKWFFNPPLPEGENLVIDSYQECHGVVVNVKPTYNSCELTRRNKCFSCSSVHRGSEIKILCFCRNPLPHEGLVEAACSMYNL